jgi:hypothetical protein
VEVVRREEREMMSLEGRTLGGCKLVRKIGEGGMGQVYLGEQMRVGNRLVAVKLVRPDDVSHVPGATQEIERRFQREAALLGQFDHPNILPVYDSGVEDGLLYLVMRYAPEGSLSDAIRGRSEHTLELPASLDFAVDIVGQVADALQYTHSRGVVHRDVKPGNVLIRIEPNGHWHALLADFGIARGQDTTPQQTQVTGTFAYMAPEQFSGKFSPASDQYALAVMAYQLLAGRTPFEGDIATMTHGHMYEAPPSLRALNPAVPEAVEAVIDRGLAKDPTQRFPSVADLAQALRAAAGGVVQPAVTVPSRPLASSTVVSGDRGAASDADTDAATPQSPQWPSPRRSPRQGVGLWRTWVAVLAALILLVAVIVGSGLIAQQQGQRQAQATQTAQAAAAQHGPTATVAAQTAAAATATAVFAFPTATGTAPIGADVTIPPPPPDGAGTLVLRDPAPKCDQPTGPNWTKDDNTGFNCDSSGHPTLTAQSSSQSACIEQQTTVIGDGYLSAIADPQSGGATLAFRQGAGQTSSNGTATSTNVTGYLFKVDKAAGAFVLASVDAAGQATTIKGGTLPSQLAQHFAIGVLFKGSAITMFINGTQLATATDSAFGSGWIGLCGDGTVTYSDVQAFSTGS